MLKLKGKTAYTITTAIYFLVGVFSLIVLFYSVAMKPNLILFLVAVAGTYVSFDNVTCSSRRACYLGK